MLSSSIHYLPRKYLFASQPHTFVLAYWLIFIYFFFAELSGCLEKNNYKKKKNIIFFFFKISGNIGGKIYELCDRLFSIS